MSDIFWTDIEQAIERIGRSVVMYDGKPVYVSTLINGMEFDDRCHRALLVNCNPTRDEVRKKLNSPKFKKFRELPTLGWMNSSLPTGMGAGAVVGAVYTARRSMTTRTHGLNDHNTLVSSFTNEGVNSYLRNGGNYLFTQLLYDKGFSDQQEGNYPTLEGTLTNIVLSSAIAISPKFCVARDGQGIRWLYRNHEVVGLFTGVDTLNLLTKFAFLREEIQDDAAFTINTIREF